jgi:hypothetical protein
MTVTILVAYSVSDSVGLTFSKHKMAHDLALFDALTSGRVFRVNDGFVHFNR